jgi:hypothetical protein
MKSSSTESPFKTGAPLFALQMGRCRMLAVTWSRSETVHERVADRNFTNHANTKTTVETLLWMAS